MTRLEPYASDEEAQRDWDHALRLVDDGKDEEAQPIFLRLWAEGYPDAAHDLGGIEERKGVSSEHLISAEEWYSKAFDAARDDAAKLNLARIIVRRRSLDRASISDERLLFARSLLEELSRNGVPQAAVFLAGHLLSGEIFPVDLEEGERLLEIGARRGYVAAFTMLRWLHFRKGRYLSALKYWALSVVSLISILLRNPKDERLLGLIKR